MKMMGGSHTVLTVMLPVVTIGMTKLKIPGTVPAISPINRARHWADCSGVRAVYMSNAETAMPAMRYRATDSIAARHTREVRAWARSMVAGQIRMMAGR